MAKKKKSGFNMAAEIRALLEADNNLSGKDVEAALKKKFPRERINSNSCGVAFSNQRKKLGLSRGGKKSVRKKRPGRTAAARPAVSVDLSALQAAKHLLAACNGDDQMALAAIRQLNSLQL